MKTMRNCKEKIAKLIVLVILLSFVSYPSFAIEKISFKTEIDSHGPIKLLQYNNTYVPRKSVSNKAMEKSYSLLDDLEIRVENQGVTQECWAFSMLKSLETNIALNNNTRYLSDFSERHMDYSTSKLFKNGINEKGFDRNVNQGGLLVEALAYLTNGQGAIPEEEMPFENNGVVIDLESINKMADTVVNDYCTFPTIYKRYSCDSDGNTVSVKYLNPEGEEYTSSELANIRNIIKDHIVNNGAISTMTVAAYSKFFNGETKFTSTAYNCNVENLERDHSFIIIGWDDEYSKDNFAEGAKPSTDGAYIVLNSYGEKSFDKGLLYVSYEDYYIENEMYGIQSSTKLDYDNIYQTDFYGGIYQVGTDEFDTGYYGAVFKRNGIKNEIIDSIGVNLGTYAKVEIFINPKSSDMDNRNLIRVGGTDTELEPGFHRIYIDPTKIIGEEFSVVIKQSSLGGSFCFTIETPTKNTDYSIVESENNSFVSKDGYNWENLADIDVFKIDMKNTDVCIKVFSDYTDEEFINMTSNIYQIGKDYVKNVKYETSIDEFKNNVISNSPIMNFVNDNNEIIEDGIITNGMTLTLSDNTTYTLIVRGDVNGDGKISLTDLSRIVLHYNEIKGFSLKDEEFEAADLNLDGMVSLVDISQFLVLYNSF